MPALKRIMIRVELPGALKRSYPRINAGASTQRLRTDLFPQPVKPILRSNPFRWTEVQLLLLKQGASTKTPLRDDLLAFEDFQTMLISIPFLRKGRASSS